MVLPLLALPFILPLCCFLLFTLLGINISVITSFSCFGENLTFINPDLNADNSVSRFGLSKAVIYIGSQSLKRYGPFVIEFRSGDFGAVKPAAYHCFNALGSASHG